MKYRILMVLFIVYGGTLYSQNIYYQYPNSSMKLESGDKIIRNIPAYKDRFFIQGDEINNLVEFLSEDTNVNYKIEIHFFGGSDEFDIDYSCYIGRNLDFYLSSERNIHNYKVVGIGNRYPIFFNKDDIKKYNIANTRMEIIVE